MAHFASWEELHSYQQQNSYTPQCILLPTIHDFAMTLSICVTHCHACPSPQRVCFLLHLTSLAGLNDYNFYLLGQAGDRVTRVEGRLPLGTKEGEHLLLYNAGEQEGKGEAHRSISPYKKPPHMLLLVQIKPHITEANPFKSHWLSMDY